MRNAGLVIASLVYTELWTKKKKQFCFF